MEYKNHTVKVDIIKKLRYIKYNSFFFKPVMGIIVNPRIRYCITWQRGAGIKKNAYKNVSFHASG